MFNRQVAHYSKKFHDTRKALNGFNFNVFADKVGIGSDNLKSALEGDTKEFRDMCYKISKSLVVGRVSCTTYASVVSKVAESVGVSYKAYAGFCLPRNNPRFEKEMEEYNKKKDTGVEHPGLATHVFVMIGDKFYEYYNGESSNIEHIDYIKI